MILFLITVLFKEYYFYSADLPRRENLHGELEMMDWVEPPTHSTVQRQHFSLAEGLPCGNLVRLLMGILCLFCDT